MQTEVDVAGRRISIGVHSNGYEPLLLLENPNNHKYFAFRDKIPNAILSQMVGELICHYYKTVKSSKILKYENRVERIRAKHNNSEDVISEKISYNILERFIKERGYFDTTPFKLPAYQCFWLDVGLEAAVNWHEFDHTAPEGGGLNDGFVRQQYGPNYPIKPHINREGIMLSNMQPFIVTKIIQYRQKLVDNSHLALTFDWLYDLKQLINDTISLVDITLNQIYIKAQYDPKPNWKFEPDKLGERHVGRLNEKFRWVYQITGNQLNIEKYLPSFNNLREIRNHLNHFDPPTFVCELDEVAEWLNQIIDVAFILYKIRKALGEPISTKLINLLLQREIYFVPEQEFRARLPRKKTHGYRTSTWQ